MVGEAIKKPYVLKTCTLDKKTIKNFIVPGWHREWRTAHLSKIRNDLAAGQHFSEPLTVTLNHGEYIMINGNHRLEAVKMLLKDYPAFKIDASVIVYRGLSEDEQIAVYDVVNNTKAETTLDRYKAHLYNSKFIKDTKDEIIRPVFRYRGGREVNTIPVHYYVMPYKHRMNGAFTGAGSTKKFIEYVGSLTDRDIDNMTKFWEDYHSAFGDCANDNLFYKYAVVGAVAKMYYNNVGITMNRKDFVQRSEKFKMRHGSSLVLLIQNGFNAAPELYNLVLRAYKGYKPLIDPLKKVMPGGEVIEVSGNDEKIVIGNNGKVAKEVDE